MIKVKQFSFNPFGVSTFVVYDPESKDAVAVDPGMISDSEMERFERFIEDNNLRLTQIVNTHLHVDHCIGNNKLAGRHGIKIAANKADEFLGKRVAQQAAAFGVVLDDDRPVGIDIDLKDGDTVEVGRYKLHVIEVPGHSPGGIALYSPDGQWVISGDSLFRGSIGRTDLPGGDSDTLVKAVKKKLLTLPGDTMVLPGHDRPTTIAQEKTNNPFLKG